MENFKYRLGSRIGAITDSVLVCLALLFVVIALIIRIDDAFNSGRFSQDDDQAWKSLMLIAHVFLLFFFAFTLWAAVKFLIATKVGTDYMETRKRAEIWRNFNVVLLLLAFAIILSAYYRVAIFPIVFSRTSILFYVGKFIEELDEAIGTPADDNNPEIVVMVDNQ